MAAEARAMLDALMGSDRNADIPKSGPSSNTLQRTKKSCYDHDICPLYCAWGIDVYELFTNTKSDIGPNPNIVQEDAHTEFKNLPSHEQERLGYEFMLYRKLYDMVRGCDRIVNRNKEKLRLEIAKAAKARGKKAGRPIDPAEDVSEEMVREAVEIMADLELREEEVEEMLVEMMKLDKEWKEVFEEYERVQKGKVDEKKDSEDSNETKDGSQSEKDGEGKEGAEKDSKEEKNDNGKQQQESESTNAQKDEEEESEKQEKKTNDDNNEINNQNSNGEESKTNSPQEKQQDEEDKSKLIQTLKSKLYTLSASQQKLISSISILTSQTIVPLRDNLQNLNKQLYYVKTDTSSDKTVCEVSGNFMSSRDAEERIAAHYAGKQYVGWKMVRDKVKELQKKYGNGPPRGGGMGGRGGGYGHHGPPPGYGYGHGHGHGYGGRGGGGYGYNHGPPPGYGGGHGGGGPPQPHFNRNRRDRSRSRDRGGEGGGSGNNSRSRHQRRRSPSPPGRWKRDRGYGGRR